MVDSAQLEKDIAQLNVALQDRARVGRWEDFAALMRQRDQMLGSVPAELKRQVLEDTLEANAQILAHAKTDRDQALERLDNVRQKSAVSSYYQNNSGTRSE